MALRVTQELIPHIRLYGLFVFFCVFLLLAYRFLQERIYYVGSIIVRVYAKMQLTIKERHGPPSTQTIRKNMKHTTERKGKRGIKL